MTDRRLMRAFDGVARTILPDATLRQDRANRSVINLDSTVNPEAIGSALSIPLAVDVAGALVIANDIGPARWAPQAVALWQVRARVRTAPSGGECTLWVAADGARIASVTIQPGETVKVSPASVDLDPGALLTLDCTVANGAADASVQLALRPRGD